VSYISYKQEGCIMMHPLKTVTFCYVYMDGAQCIKNNWAFSFSEHVHQPVRPKRCVLGSL